MKVNCRIFSNLSNQTYCKTIGARGAPGVPAVTPVEVTSPGPGTVSEATVPRVNLAVLELVLKLKLVSTPTKVVIHILLKHNHDNVPCRHLDHRIQPGRDVHTLHQGDILTPLHPWQSPSVAHSDREHSLWWSLPWYLHLLPGAPTERRWLEGFLLHSD